MVYNLYIQKVYLMDREPDKEEKAYLRFGLRQQKKGSVSSFELTETLVR